jgi:hypothetical protein
VEKELEKKMSRRWGAFDSFNPSDRLRAGKLTAGKKPKCPEGRGLFFWTQIPYYPANIAKPSRNEVRKYE